jgi:hypothetical protein
MKFFNKLHSSLASAASDLVSDTATHILVRSSMELLALQVTFLNILDAAHHACFPWQPASLPEVQYVPGDIFEFTIETVINNSVLII